MKKKYIEKIVPTKVAEYVEMYNKSHCGTINRMDVYDMIKSGELKAHKGPKGAWIIELPVREEVKEEKSKKAAAKKKTVSKKVKEYSVKEWVEVYNKKNKETFSDSKVRKLLEKGIIQGHKENRKWVITTSPSKKITLARR